MTSGMLYLPLVFALLRLADAHPRLETTAAGDDARRLAADVLLDADSIADIELVGGAAVFDVALSGEHHELRLELDGRGRVVGAASGLRPEALSRMLRQPPAWRRRGRRARRAWRGGRAS